MAQASAVPAAAPPPAARREAVRIARRSGDIRVDGITNDEGWRNATSLPITVYKPVYRAAPTQRTVFRLTYDDDALYVAANSYVTDTASILLGSMQRDADPRADFLNVLLDTYRDGRAAVIFSTTPAGNTIDWTVADDAETDDWKSAAWNTVWDVKTRVDGEGWHAEMRVPFTSLRFEAPDGRVEIGISMNRLIASSNERVGFPDFDPTASAAFFKPSLAQPIVLEGVRPRRELRLIPYVSVRSVSASPGIPAATNADAGGDAKIAVTPNITADLTVNPDFAGTEFDEQRVNLTRFPLFFPEQRQFFMERASMFDVRTGMADRVFNSRRIGLSDEGVPIPVLAGGRVVAKQGLWDFGLLGAATRAGAGQQAAQNAVLRIRRNVRNAGSHVGFMVTDRTAAEGQGNTVVAADAVQRFGGIVVTSALAVQARGRDSTPAGATAFAPYAARLNVQRARAAGLGFRFAFSASGEQYAPALGFVGQPDIARGYAELSYGVLSEGNRILRLMTPTLSVGGIVRESNRAFDASQVSAAWRVETRKGAALQLASYIQSDHLEAPLALGSGVSVPAGNYRAQGSSLTISPGAGTQLAWSASIRHGALFDGRQTSLVVGPDFQFAPHLVVSANYGFDAIDFPSRNQSATWHVGTLRAQLAATTQLWFAGSVQLNTSTDVREHQVRARYIVREGQELWLVYAASSVGKAGATLSTRRPSAFTVKYSHPVGR